MGGERGYGGDVFFMYREPLWRFVTPVFNCLCRNSVLS